MGLSSRIFPGDTTWCHRVRLPDGEGREGEKEVLADLPLVMVVFKVQTDNIAVAAALEASHAGLGDMNTERGRGVRGVEVVEGKGADKTDSAIEEPYQQRGNHPAIELCPVPPACADVDHGHDIM